MDEADCAATMAYGMEPLPAAATAVHRRNGYRQYNDCGSDLPWALRRQA